LTLAAHARLHSENGHLSPVPVVTYPLPCFTSWQLLIDYRLDSHSVQSIRSGRNLFRPLDPPQVDGFQRRRREWAGQPLRLLRACPPSFSATIGSAHGLCTRQRTAATVPTRAFGALHTSLHAHARRICSARACSPQRVHEGAVQYALLYTVLYIPSEVA
jgi:hypothetical protein